MQQASHPVLLIGDFRVEPTLNRVGRGPQTVRIAPKAMQVLMRLAERPGEAVSRDDLLDTVWADTAVNEDVLTRAIADLRKVFQDNPRRPRVIETIPKSGYRLVAPVASGGGRPSGTETGLEKDAIALPPSRLRRLIATVGIVIPAVLLAGYALYFRGPSNLPDPPILRLQTQPLTTLPGVEVLAQASPDGKQAAYARRSGAEGSWDIYTQLIGSPSTLQLTSRDAAEAGPAWSPDGTRLAFMRYQDEQCEIFSVAALGGEERKLGSCGRNSYPDLAYSPDGLRLAFSDKQDADVSFGIYLLRVESGEKRLLSAPDGQHWGDRDPAFSPDGRWVSFTRSLSMATQDIYRVPVEGGRPERLTFDGRAIDGHAWTSDSRHIVFVSSRGGRPGLWRIPASGGTPVWIAADAMNPRRPSLSRQGDVMVFEQWSVISDIQRLDLGQDNPQPQTWISSSRQDDDPQFSPDAGRAAFTSTRSGAPEIWVSDGKEALQLTRFGGPYTGSPQWSPDGKRIAFDSRPQGQADVYIVESAGGPPRRLTSHEANDLSPSWSRDGAWVYFGSNRKEGIWQIWKVPVEGGRPVQVTAEGGYSAFESPDGQWLCYTKYGHPGLWKIPLQGGAEQAIEPLQGHPGPFAPGPEGIYFVESEGMERYISLLRTSAESPVRLASVPAMPASALSVSPDGRSLLFSQVIRRESDLITAHFRD